MQIQVSKNLATTTQLHHKLDERSENKKAILQSTKDMHNSRNTVKCRVIRKNKKVNRKLHLNLHFCVHFLSLFPTKSIHITSSVTLLIYARIQFVRYYEIHEELLRFSILHGTKSRVHNCSTAVNILSDFRVDISKMVSVTTNATHSMTGKEAGFGTLFTKHICHFTVSFHCSTSQEALCSKYGLTYIDENWILLLKRFASLFQDF
jgi:hypothetical protein